MISIDLMIVYLYYFIEKSKKKGKRKKQLHISYHNGDHYNSVRRISDIKGPNSYHEANKPANIFIDVRYLIRIKIKPNSHILISIDIGLMNNKTNHFQTLQPEEEITQTTYGSSEGMFDSRF